MSRPVEDAAPHRYLSNDDRRTFCPVHAVWELTLACDLKCRHCGSRAGPKRRGELSLAECLDVVNQLADMGVRHVTLIGGEAYLRKDWTDVVAAIRQRGMDCTLQTGGLHFNDDRLQRGIDAGLQGLGVSVDGLEDVHDWWRGVDGSFAAALQVLDRASARGLPVSANTQINARVLPQLEDLFEVLVAHGITAWQVQLTVAMGRAADRPDALLQPYQLLELMPRLAALYREGLTRGVVLQPGNNIGYFGPYERLWRGHGDEQVFWSGCNAGQNTIGIESDGTIKGCPSLPTNAYSGGNVRARAISAIWQTPQLAFARQEPRARLWGFCQTCYYAEICGGGCTWTSHSLLGRPGNNPYCHHRALELAKDGYRERVVRVEAPPGCSFDHGRFEVQLETLADGTPVAPARAARGATFIPVISRTKTHSAAPTPADLVPCRACGRHLWRDQHAQCPHCGTKVAVATRAHARTVNAARRATQRLARLLAQYRAARAPRIV